ncbi:hypothetical protein [Nocardioides sp. SYSU D00065]|uniref:hypothetical protein n=1 Tax=Nocardioides sp. SYSU D00065 TaxID=2817378 RepID=UPI001B3385C1|nr:hypothetical protein [Nocardioides sp. SYSU D00065]
MTTDAMRRVLTLLVLLVAGQGFVFGSSPAAGAATCASSGGVSVVVDFRELGGSTITACSADGGGRSAAAIFDSVGVDLSYATRQAGFVCRVEGVPLSDPCVNTSPANAYWGLWWANGSSASWTYSSYGVQSLTVPAGGSVAFSWQQDRTAGSNVPPGVAPPVTKTSAPSPTSTPTSSTSPTPSPSASPSTQGNGSTGGNGNGNGNGGSAGGDGGSGDGPGATDGSGSGTGNGAGDSGESTGGRGAGSTGDTDAPSSGASPSASGSPSASASAPAAPSESPVATESPSDSRTKSGRKQRSRAVESPGDSTASDGAAEADSGSESPSDSSASAPAGADAPTPAGEPARVPAAVTWGVVALLGVAIAVGGVVARRRRGV